MNPRFTIAAVLFTATAAIKSDPAHADAMYDELVDLIYKHSR